jgi:methylated-DNA-[protein]-cysteine S-methyltransferase
MNPASRPPTAFERRVYAAVSRIPRGRVATYGELARHLGCGSAQAVGQALRRNPFAPRVPCHRVVAASLAPGGFQGQRAGPALRRKLALLTKEGVRFSPGPAVDPTCVWRFARG